MKFQFGRRESTPEEDAKKLSRTELLEMLIDETKEAERLRLENERLRAELENCRRDLDRSASLQIILRRLERIAGLPEKDWTPMDHETGQE